MAKLSEYQGEEALDILADILEPATLILADAQVKEMYDNHTPVVKLVQYIIKNHKKEIIEILARMDGEEVENYKVNFFTLPSKIIELLNDKELVGFFTS